MSDGRQLRALWHCRERVFHLVVHPIFDAEIDDGPQGAVFHLFSCFHLCPVAVRAV